MTTVAEPKRYRVAWAYATAKVPGSGLVPNSRGAMAIREFHHGAILPVDTAPESISHLLRRGAIEEVVAPD